MQKTCDVEGGFCARAVADYAGGAIMAAPTLSRSLSMLRSPLFGRDDDLAVLQEALDEVIAGQPRVVTVLGPAGVGKTRLIQDFILGQREGGNTPVNVYRGSARDHATGYGIFARLLRARFGLVEGMDPEDATQQIHHAVSKVHDDRKVGDVVYFLGQLLGLSFPESPLTKAVKHDAKQTELLRRAVFRAFVEADAAMAPQILVFDDLHLAHQQSLALLRYLIECLDAPVLLLCAARPELLAQHDDWDRMGGARHEAIELPALEDAAAAAVMRALLARCDAPVDALVETACSFAVGNPAMLEQMVRIYHDAGVLQAVHEQDKTRWVVHADKLASAQLPVTIEDAVSARLSALDIEEKRLLEYASVMGSVFWEAGFVAVQRDGEAAPDYWGEEDHEDSERISEILQDLVSRDYVLRLPDSTFSGTNEYIFKHNKERVAIEGQIGAAAKRRYHRAVADWLEHQPKILSNDEYCSMLASHREGAGQGIEAGRMYLRAANAARASYANVKACEYYERGLALLGDAAVAQRILALHNYGDVLQMTGRINDALSAFEEMLALAYRLDLRTKGGAAHNRIGRLYREIGELDEAERHLKTALALFRDAADERGISSTIDDIGKLHWMRGEYDVALAELRDGLARREQLGDQRSIALSLNNLGSVLQDSGDFKAALTAFDQALQIRRNISDLFGVVVTLNNLGTVEQDLRSYDRALMLFQEAREVAEEIGSRNRLAIIFTNIGECYYSSNKPNKAIEVLRKAETLCDELGDKIGLADALRGLGKAYLLQGDLAHARDCISRAVDIFAAARSKVHLGSALRTLGEITAAGGWGAAHTKSAREYYARSVAIFEQTGNEVELARTFRVYAKFLKAEPEYQDDLEAHQEAQQMAVRAEEILQRLRVSAADRSEPPPTTPHT